MEQEQSRKRGRYGAQLKARILAECETPGASVAKVAISHGIIANIAHGWRKLARHGEAEMGVVPREFVPLTVASTPEVRFGPQCTEVDLRRGTLTMKKDGLAGERSGGAGHLDVRVDAVSHYLFGAEFCNPASEWEKGQIEKSAPQAVAAYGPRSRSTQAPKRIRHERVVQLHRRTDCLLLLHEESVPVNSTMTPAELATLADDIEARAWVDYYDAAPPAMRDTLGIAHDRVADATLLLAPGVDLAFFNRAIGLGLRSPANENSVAQVAAAFAAAGARNWWLHVNAHAQPRETALSLEAAGWRSAERANLMKMLRRAGEVDTGATTLRVAAATDDDVDAIADAITSGFGLPSFFAQWLRALHGRPRWRLYGAFDGATAVGGGALFVEGEQAWVGIGSMLESHRRRGGQRGVMGRRVDDATRAGVRWIATETGEPTNEVNPSLLNMLRCGFECVALRRNLLPPLAIRVSPGTKT